MAQIVIPIPDTIAARVLLAFSNSYGYQTEIPNPAWTPESGPEIPQLIPNPITRLVFSRSKLLDHIKDVVKASEAETASQAARIAALAAAESEIILS